MNIHLYIYIYIYNSYKANKQLQLLIEVSLEVQGGTESSYLQNHCG